MFACTHCQRYVHDDSTNCPFCRGAVVAPRAQVGLNAAQRLSRSSAFALRAMIIAAPAAVLACGGQSEDGTDGSDDQGASGGIAAVGGQSTGGDSGASDGGTTSVGGGFEIIPPEGGFGGMGGWVGTPIYGGPFPDMMRAKV